MSLRDCLDSSQTQPEAPSRFTASLIASCKPRPTSALTVPFSAFTAVSRVNPVLIVYSWRPNASFGECIASLRRVYTLLMVEVDLLSRVIRPFERLLRLLGVWDQHYARLSSRRSFVLRDLAPLQELLAWKPDLRRDLEAGDLPSDPDFRLSLENYLLRRGHRGCGELDLARPRLDDAPEALIPLLLQPPPPKPPLSLGGWLTLPIWWLARRNVRSRDTVRDAAMFTTAYLRKTLLALAEDAAAKGLLPNRDAIWEMDIDAVTKLDEKLLTTDENA